VVGEVAHGDLLLCPAEAALKNSDFETVSLQKLYFFIRSHANSHHMLVQILLKFCAI
jgi:hypothetical protein